MHAIGLPHTSKQGIEHSRKEGWYDSYLLEKMGTRRGHETWRRSTGEGKCTCLPKTERNIHTNLERCNGGPRAHGKRVDDRIGMSGLCGCGGVHYEAKVKYAASAPSTG